MYLKHLLELLLSMEKRDKMLLHKKKYNWFLFLISIMIVKLTFSQSSSKPNNTRGSMKKSESEWKKILSAEEYHVLREKGTERAYTGKYDKHFEEGTYVCSGCGTKIFESDSKYNSGCGWPAFSRQYLILFWKLKIIVLE